MRNYSVLLAMVLGGAVLYGLTAGTLAEPAVAEVVDGAAAPDWAGRVAALEARVAKLEKMLENYKGVVDQVSRVQMQLDTLKKINERLDGLSDDLGVLKETVRRLAPQPVNPYGIPLQWSAKTPDGLSLVVHPVTLPDFLKPLQKAVASKKQAAHLTIFNEMKDKAFTFNAKRGSLILIMENGDRFESLDSRSVFLTMTGRSLGEMPELLKSNKVFPGERGELVLLFSSSLDFMKVKSAIWKVGETKILLKAYTGAGKEKAKEEKPGEKGSK